MRIQKLNCFGATPGEGNLALVIEGDHSTEQERQAFARVRNTTCVFIDSSQGEPDIECVVDYFYPHMRSPLCLHATLAVARILLDRLWSYHPLIVKTAMRHQRLILAHDDDTCYVQLTRQSVPQVPALPDLAALLGQPGFTPASVPQVASVGSPKLLVEVADRATLYALQPDLPAITGWGKANGINGIYAWCRRPDGSFEGRNFNHLDPALEDSATGVAAGALTDLLGHGITLLQGRATGRNCLLRTRIEGDFILVGGAAEPA